NVVCKVFLGVYSRRDLISHVALIDHDQPCCALVKHVPHLLEVAALDPGLKVACDSSDGGATSPAGGESTPDSDRREDGSGSSCGQTPAQPLEGTMPGTCFIRLFDV